jgi:hypothetical protein
MFVISCLIKPCYKVNKKAHTSKTIVYYAKQYFENCLNTGTEDFVPLQCLDHGYRTWLSAQLLRGQPPIPLTDYQYEVFQALRVQAL